MITGPGSPSVLSNMMVSIEQHVDWIADAIAHLDERPAWPRSSPPGRRRTPGWTHVNEVASYTLFPKANSWYMGANVPGKPRVFMPYAGRRRQLPGQVRRGGPQRLRGLRPDGLTGPGAVAPLPGY